MLGSARFSEEWIELHNRIYPKVRLTKSNKKILCFMPQHAQYNVDLEYQLQLIKEIDKLDEYIIYFKPHTRNQNESFFRDISKLKNVIMANNILSSQLIDISDAIIVYGSSIVLEAIQKHKLVLYPKFLHKNTTIFEKENACETFTTLENMINYLKKGLVKTYSEENEQKCIIVASNSYNSKTVLQDYIDFFIEKYRVNNV